jgi:hypothetical protein
VSVEARGASPDRTPREAPDRIGTGRGRRDSRTSSGARHDGQAVGRSTRAESDQTMGNGSMRGTVTEGLYSEWSNSRVEWQFSGLERNNREAKSPTRPDGVGGNAVGEWATREIAFVR